MYVAINGVKNNKSVYIMQSYRKENGQTSSRVYRKLGRLDELLARFAGNQDEMMTWAKQEAAKDTSSYNSKTEPVSLSLFQNARIPKDEERSFNVGYLFLQQLCTELRLDNICRKIRSRHKFTYDFHAILTDLIYARILSPSSKLSSYSFCNSLLEPPKYSLQNLYRALSVMAEESGFIQEELYRNSNFVTQETKGFFTMTVRTITLKLSRMMTLGGMEKAKNIVPIPLLPWACLWMRMESLLLLMFSPETRTNRPL